MRKNIGIYRGKRKDNGEWVCGCYCYNPHMKRAEIFSFDDIRSYVYEVVPETIGECSFIPDKNGTDIFEGDIIKATINLCGKRSEVIGVVIFEMGTFKIKVKNTNEHRTTFAMTANLVEPDAKVTAFPIENNFINRGYILEVIGNIGDNPELVKFV